MLKGKWLIMALVFAGSFWMESLSFAQTDGWKPKVRLTNNTELSIMSPELRN